MATDFNVKYLTIVNVAAEQVETIARAWKTVETVFLVCPREGLEVLRLDCIMVGHRFPITI